MSLIHLLLIINFYVLLEDYWITNYIIQEF